MKKSSILCMCFFVVAYVMGQEKIKQECFVPRYARKGDTLDFNFYTRYPEDNIEVEWRKCPKSMNNQCRDKFHYLKIFKIKNNFSHDIYLKRKLGSGTPGCFTSGL